MLQKITAFNTYSETVLELTCPKCGKRNEFGLLRFMDANNNHKLIACVDCKDEFYIEVLCLTRAAEHRNEAEKEQTCPRCQGNKYVIGVWGAATCSFCKGEGHV